MARYAVKPGNLKSTLTPWDMLAGVLMWQMLREVGYFLVHILQFGFQIGPPNMGVTLRITVSISPFY